MLKKSILMLVLAALALPAVAGDIKIHGNWPCTYVPLDVTTVNVKLNVGYYIHVVNQKAFTVDQDSTNKDPYHTYTGCFSSKVKTNFDATISASIAKSNSPANNGDAKWEVTSIDLDGNNVAEANADNNLVICVKGSNIKIENLTGGAKGVVVAHLTIKAVPTAACAACGD